jgi:hypothetical protein
MTSYLALHPSSVANIDVLKREVHHLSRELLQERTKVKALAEELENPLNVHRHVNCRQFVLHANPNAECMTVVPAV